MIMVYFTDKQRLNIAKQQYVDTEIDGDVRIDNKKTLIGKVANYQDNRNGNGEQIYTITPNGTKDNPDEVKEVTVLFRGSTAPFDGSDWTTDWFRNDIPMAARILGKVGDSADPRARYNNFGTKQLKDSAQALQEVMKKYPNAKVNIYGHSLGSMDAQYAMANLSSKDIQRINGAWLYNGPNTYSALNEQQKKRVDSIKGRIRNYIDHKDFIGLGYADVGSAESVGIVGHINSIPSNKNSAIERITDQHMWGGYQYDKQGNILLTEGTEETYYKELYKHQLKSTELYMSEFERHKHALASGGYSTNEKIFLDSEQSTIIASGLDSIALAGLTRISTARDKAITQIENFYDLSKTTLESTCTALNAGEIETILISEGVSKTDIVEPLRSHFDAEVTKATAIATAFSNVRSDIESAIKKMTEEDAQLAGDFNQWSKI